MEKNFQLFVCFLMLLSCRNKQEIIKPQLQDITESVYASGTIKSRNQYQVFSPVNGLIQTIEVTEGDKVKKDQAIVTLVNDAPRLAEENARLSAAYAAEAANRDKLRELAANIELSRIRMQNDSLLLERQRNLWKQEIGTRFDLEQRELAYRNAVTAHRAAQLRYNDLLQQSRFATRQSQKNLQISNRQLGDFTIQSKMDGKVYRLLKEPGEMVNTQTPIAVIGDADDFLLELQVDEYDIGRIRLGQRVTVSMDSYKGQVFEAVVQQINPIMEERSRSFTVEARFTSRPEILYPNLTAEANIIIQVKNEALVIPRSFLIGDSLVLLQNGTQQKVVTGVKDYQYAEIISGLQPGAALQKPAE